MSSGVVWRRSLKDADRFEQDRNRGRRMTEGDWGAYGRFDSCSRSFSLEFWLLRHTTGIAAIFATTAAAAVAGTIALKRR